MLFVGHRVEATRERPGKGNAAAVNKAVTMHCVTVSLAQGGDGPGTMRGAEHMHDAIMRGGFRSVERHRLEHDDQSGSVGPEVGLSGWPSGPSSW